MESYKLYDYMAAIIRYLLDENFEADKAYAVAADDEENMLEEAEELLEEDSFSSTDFDVLQNVSEDKLISWAFVLQKLDEKASARLEEELWIDELDFESVRYMDSLNSKNNVKETNIIILPRYTCIWEGKSRDEHHAIDINTFLYHSFYVEVNEDKVEGKYTLKNYILNPQDYGLCMDDENELTLQVAVSPLSDEVRLDDERYQEHEKGAAINFFMIKELDECIQAKLTKYIEKTMRKADENGNKILVFPEMLGTVGMKRIVIESIKKKNFNSLHFIVFPSIWEYRGRHQNHNTAYVIDYEGNEWFGQEKLRRFPWEKDGNTFLEDIIQGEEIHIIHCEGYGSIAVAVCRSELDRKVRDLLMQKLKVKLILCPSWTEGSHEFECSIMTGIEHKCNVAWCNTCSALEIDKGTSRTVGIITTFGKNKNFSNMSLKDCKFPENICLRNCGDGCFYSGRIYGTDYRENQTMEVEADGCENEQFCIGTE